MAATVEAGRLTEAHRVAQLRIGRAVVAQLLAVWPLLDLADIDGTTARWLLAAIPIVQAARRMSARLSGAYLTTFRTMELGVDADPVVPLLAEQVNRQQVLTSLTVTGPIALKTALARGIADTVALEQGAAGSAAAGMRHALDGGRSTIQDTIGADERAIGWARVTSGHACAFCAMLASRGAVYKHETVGFRSHDSCGCGAEPVYRRDASLPAGSQQYQDLWRQAKDDPGDTVHAFRRLVEAAA